MSSPSFENIDQWLFEYTEGNLSPAQVSQLEMFLLNNPEFEADLDAWQFAKVDASPTVYPGVVGRKRKPIPFWVSATAVLTVVFVAGGLFGAYMASGPADDEAKLMADSAVNEMSHRLVSNSLLASRVEQQSVIGQDYSGSASKPTLNRIPRLSQTLFSNYPDVQASNNKSFDNLVFSENEKGQSVNKENIDKNQQITVPFLNNELIQEERVVEPTEVAEVNSLEKQRLPEDENRIVENTPVNGEIDHDATAKAMTRGSGDRISSNHKSTFSNKLKSTMRKIARMTENPIALTNSKDIYYHVPGMQTLNVNAATAGSLLRPRIQSISRAQWTGHSNQQLMNELSFDTYVRSIRGGIGVQLNHAYYNDGTYNVGQIALSYSPKLTINRNFSIEPGIRLKMGDKRLNAHNLVQGQLIEMERGNEKIFFNETPENYSKDLWYKDVALALNSNTKWFSFGFQVDNLGRHSNNVYNSSDKNERAGMHYTANLGTDFVSRSKIISFSPYIMCQKVENLSEIWGGSIFRYKKLTVGGAYSSTGDYAGSIGLKTNSFMISYNADMTQSVLTSSRLFSQQVTIRILMNKGRYGRTMLKQ